MPWLEWLDRKQGVSKVGQAPYRLLEPVHKLDHGESDSPNMLIEGDNLDALKALLPYYAGQVKSIYIDPPFNTGAAFDNYDDNIEHSIWLSLMYQRLDLLHQLLKDDGSIFIHLDDNQIDYCRVISDEIFGRNNFIGRITVDVRSPSAFSTVNPGVFKASEYILWFAKNKKYFEENSLRIPRQVDYAYNLWLTNPDAPYSEWKFIPVMEAYAAVPRGTRVQHPKAILAKFDRFILDNAARVCRYASISDTGAGEAIVELKRQSVASTRKIFRLQRGGRLDDVYVSNGQQILFYSKNVSVIDGEPTATTMLTNIWSDIAWEGIAGEGGVKFKKGKKPEKLLRRCIELSSEPGDIVLDSFLGSGTTAAVAHKMQRQWIGIEMGAQAQTHCYPRLKAVVDGEQSGISERVGWKGGGGFRFYKLGPAVFDDNGQIREGIKFEWLAAHVWFAETGHARSTKAKKSPFLGVNDGTGYYLLYNGILGDKRPDGGNVLTLKLLSELPEHDGRKVIYGEATRLSSERLQSLGIVFKQTPYDIRAR